jgi:hypothetical protein
MAVVTTRKWHRYKTGDVVEIFGVRVIVGRILSRRRFEVTGLAH